MWNRRGSITSLLWSLSARTGIPLSTLKSSAQSLRELELITYGDYYSRADAKLTSAGKAMLFINR